MSTPGRQPAFADPEPELLNAVGLYGTDMGDRFVFHAHAQIGTETQLVLRKVGMRFPEPLQKAGVDRLEVDPEKGILLVRMGLVSAYALLQPDADLRREVPFVLFLFDLLPQLFEHAVVTVDCHHAVGQLPVAQIHFAAVLFAAQPLVREARVEFLVLRFVQLVEQSLPVAARPESIADEGGDADHRDDDEQSQPQLPCRPFVQVGEPGLVLLDGCAVSISRTSASRLSAPSESRAAENRLNVR